jgi:hypothetical protein
VGNWIPPTAIPSKNDGDPLTAKDLKDVIASLQTFLLTSGDVTGPGLSIDGELAVFLGTTGTMTKGTAIIYANPNAAGSSTAGIQEALNAAAVVGATKVIVRGGTHLVSATVSHPSNIHVQAQGMGVTTVKLANSANVILWQNADTSGGNSNLSISDITFDGNYLNQTSNTNVLVHMKRVTNLQVDRCEFGNCRADGLYIQTAAAAAVKRAWVQRSYFHNTLTNVTTNAHAALYLATSNAAITQVDISTNVFENIGTDNTTTGLSQAAIVVDGANSDITTVHDNKIVNTWGNGIKVTASGQVDITCNWIKSAGQQNVTDGGNGIFFDSTGTGRAKINGNTVDTVAVNSDNGIEVSGLDSDVEMNGNRVRNVLNSLKNGMAVGGWNNVVVGVNHVTACAGVGFASLTDGPTSSKVLTVTGLVCVACGLGGVNIRGRQRFTLAGVVCTDSTSGFGIQIGEGTVTSGAESTDGTVAGCVCVGNATHGLVIDGEQVGAAGQRARRIAITGGCYSANTLNGVRLVNVVGVDMTGVTVDANLDDGVLLAGVLCSDVNIVGGSIRNHSVAGKFGIKGTATTLTRISIDQSVTFQNNNTNTSADLGVPVLSGATPSVECVQTAMVTNGGATTVTNLTGGRDGQIVILHHTDANTTYQDGTNIFLNGSANYNPTATSLLTLMRRNGLWYEQGRSPN